MTRVSRVKIEIHGQDLPDTLSEPPQSADFKFPKFNDSFHMTHQ